MPRLTAALDGHGITFLLRDLARPHIESGALVSVLENWCQPFDANRRFMVGDALTLADIDVAGPFSQVDRARFPFREFPNLFAWHDNLLRTVPAWAETKAEVDDRMDSFLASVGVEL